LGANPYKDNQQSVITAKARTVCRHLSDTPIKPDITSPVSKTIHPAPENNSTTIGTGLLAAGPANPNTTITSSDSCDRITPESTSTFYRYQAPIDAKIQTFLDTQNPTQQAAFSLSQYTRIDKILSTTASHRQQYNVHNCCVVVLDRDGGLISMNTCA
jgi:hypothetical protein